MEIKFIVDVDIISVKEYLKDKPVSRKLVTYIKKHGEIIVNNKKVKNYYILRQNDELVLRYEEKINDEIIPNFTPVEILYEDECFLICNKPTNLPSHPSKKHFTDTLVNRIRGYFINTYQNCNVHLVTRLDAETSGLILCAKNRYYHYLINEDIENVKRMYLAKAKGIITPSKGLIDKPISRLPAPQILRIIDENGKPAKTLYRVVSYGDDYSIVTLRLFTGRTHQIRVHLQSIGHPIIGDKLYGNEDKLMYLHCHCLEFTHPLTNQRIKIVKLPHWYKEV